MMWARAMIVTCALALWGMPALAAGQVGYGSRAGMNVTVVGVEGLGTENAIVHTKHTAANAKEFCQDYLLDESAECIGRTLREVRLNDRIVGNCRTGEFVMLSGDRIRFAGENRRALRRGEISLPRYVIIENRQMLEGNSYATALEQFDAICPGRVNVRDAYIQ